ncbi:MAG: Gfo/Idh/MocA family oxidoreductase [Roseivirga sp.]
MKRIGIIGWGMIAKMHAKAIQAMDTAMLWAVYTSDPNKAKAITNEYGCKVFTDLDAFLDNEELEIVTIATPSGAHLEPIVHAVQKGKHVICEKPLEITPARVLKAEKEAQKHGVLLGGIFNRRFNPAVATLKEAIEQQRFGTISLSEMQVKWFRDQAYYDSAAWRGTWALDGGGALMNQAIHTVDLLIHFMGMPVRLSATVSTLTHERIEVEDTAVAILEFANGAKGMIQASTSTYSSGGRPAEIQISGDAGAVILRDEHFDLWDFKVPMPMDDKVQSGMMTGGKQALGANDPSHINYLGHQLNFENFVAATEGREALQVTAQEALKSVVVINAIYESAGADGKWIEIDTL